MRGVDVADHIRGNYTCQVRTHKWWHRIYMFLMDLSSVQMYLYYLQILKDLEKSHEAIIHLQFMNGYVKHYHRIGWVLIKLGLQDYHGTQPYIVQGGQLIAGSMWNAENELNSIAIFVDGNSCASKRCATKNTTLQGCDLCIR
jgi:hypothetical protein